MKKMKLCSLILIALPSISMSQTVNSPFGSPINPRILGAAVVAGSTMNNGSPRSITPLPGQRNVRDSNAANQVKQEIEESEKINNKNEEKEEKPVAQPIVLNKSDSTDNNRQDKNNNDMLAAKPVVAPTVVTVSQPVKKTLVNEDTSRATKHSDITSYNTTTLDEMTEKGKAMQQHEYENFLSNQ